MDQRLADAMCIDSELSVFLRKVSDRDACSEQHSLIQVRASFFME